MYFNCDKCIKNIKISLLYVDSYSINKIPTFPNTQCELVCVPIKCAKNIA